MTIHIAHIVHCNAGTRRAGSLLLLRLHAGFVRIHHAILHRLNSLFARRLRQHTAYIRLIHGRAAVAPLGIRDGAARP